MEPDDPARAPTRHQAQPVTPHPPEDCSWVTQRFQRCDKNLRLITAPGSIRNHLGCLFERSSNASIVTASAIDKQSPREYLWEIGAGSVIRLRSILILVVLGAAACVSVAPRADLPETAFNEADAPVNLAPPVQLRFQVLSPAVDPVVASPSLPLHCADCVVNRLVLAPAAIVRQRPPHSFQDLLCTFLI